MQTFEKNDSTLISSSNHCRITAQRSHANFTENQTSLLGAMAITGLQYPVFAASLGGAWAAGRLFYLIGYTSDKGPSGRLPYVILRLYHLVLQY